MWHGELVYPGVEKVIHGDLVNLGVIRVIHRSLIYRWARVSQMS
jgi:hypothetical protein